MYIFQFGAIHKPVSNIIPCSAPVSTLTDVIISRYQSRHIDIFTPTLNPPTLQIYPSFAPSYAIVMAQRISRRKATKMDYRALKKILHSLYDNKCQTPLSFDEAEECGIEVMRMSWDEEHLFFTPLQSPAVEQLLRDLDEMPPGEGTPYPSIEGGVSDTRKLSEYFDDHFADVIEDTRWSCIG